MTCIHRYLQLRPILSLLFRINGSTADHWGCTFSVQLLKQWSSNPAHCYADDSTLHGNPSLPSNRNNVASSITLDLDKLNKWGSQNLINFNANKTQCCLISKRKNKNLPDILFGSNTLTMCDSLSVHVGRLCRIWSVWNEHISSVAKSAAKKIGFLFRSVQIFHALASSHSLQGPNPPLSRIRLSFVERSLQIFPR